MPEKLQTWWNGLSPLERRSASIVALTMLGYTIHYLVYCVPQPFFIEDAGISFAYARNLVEGHGLVPFVGSERVEGYSNALWTFLCALFHGLGVEGWASSKWMGAIFGIATLPYAYALVRRALPDSPSRETVALVAPAMLAASPQFVIWNASGLENSLYCLLLAAGMYRLVVESEEGGRPVSAILFFLLSMTRPEGLMYVAVALFARVQFAIGAARVIDLHPGRLLWSVLTGRELRRLLVWVAVFTVPWLLYNYWRYSYFGWEFPNTYYAKLGKGTSFAPYGWTRGGWKYVNGYFVLHGMLEAAPLLVLAMVGFKGWRRWVSVALVAIVALALFWDGKAGLPQVPRWWSWASRSWVQIRVWTLLVTAVGMGVLTFGRKGWRARGLLWAVAAAAIFFAIYASGDWMKAHRWFNIVVVALFPVVCIGLGELLDALPRMSWRIPRLGLSLRVAVVLPLLAAFVGVEVWHTNVFANDPETAVRDVHRRVRYMQWVQNRLDLDFVTLMDVDMGAHLYFTDWGILDMAGLIDVPVARHRDYNKAFMREYVFVERKPEFAHVHGGWAKTTGIPRIDEWDDQYMEIPGYPIGRRKLHVGNHIRRDLFIDEVGARQTERSVSFDQGITLVDWSVPSPVVANGGQVFLDTRWNAGFLKNDFRVLAFLQDDEGYRTVTALVPGYNWYEPSDWKDSEVVRLIGLIQVPEKAAQGSYRLGLVLLDNGSGAVVQSLAEPREGENGVPVATFMPGDHVLPTTIEVVSFDEAMAAAEKALSASREAAEGGRCQESWTFFKNATRHITRNADWRDEHQAEARGWVASCWALASDELDVRAERVDALKQAVRFDLEQPEVKARARAFAAELVALGDQAYDAGQLEQAYPLYRDAIALDGRLTDVRRRAEEARDVRLGIAYDDLGRPDDKNRKVDRKLDKKNSARKPQGPGRADPEGGEAPAEGAADDTSAPEGAEASEKAADDKSEVVPAAPRRPFPTKLGKVKPSGPSGKKR